MGRKLPFYLQSILLNEFRSTQILLGCLWMLVGMVYIFISVAASFISSVKATVTSKTQSSAIISAAEVGGIVFTEKTLIRARKLFQDLGITPSGGLTHVYSEAALGLYVRRCKNYVVFIPHNERREILEHDRISRDSLKVRSLDSLQKKSPAADIAIVYFDDDGRAGVPEGQLYDSTFDQVARDPNLGAFVARDRFLTVQRTWNQHQRKLLVGWLKPDSRKRSGISPSVNQTIDRVMQVFSKIVMMRSPWDEVM